MPKSVLFLLFIQFRPMGIFGYKHATISVYPGPNPIDFALLRDAGAAFLQWDV